MSAPYSIAIQTLPAPASTAVDAVLDSLRLRPVIDRNLPRVLVVQRGSSAPIAALVHQGGSFREDKAAIESLKGADEELPIIYISRSTRPQRETAIRRLGIHYFLAYPVDAEELRLVLEVLIRATSPVASFERFFTR